MTPAARWPTPDSLMPVVRTDPPHPAVLPVETLLSRCKVRTQRRGGPGGQHRNKVATGVFITEDATGIVGEATESRSQRTNRRLAMFRLRMHLAVGLRTHPCEPADELMDVTRRRLIDRRLKISMTADDYPAAVALLLDQLHIAGGQPSLVSAQWNVSTSSILRLIRGDRGAMALLQSFRRHHGRLPLR